MVVEERAVDAARTLEVVRLLAGSSAAPRVAMRGSSMMPLLHEPMVLALGPVGDGRVGDIVVFERAGQLVAHRITRVRRGVLQTCGDAVPWSPEYPEASSIVGKVVAVMAHDGSDATRIDTPSFWRRGIYAARLRGLRAVPFRLRSAARRMVKALPWFRPRPYVALVQAMSAAVRSDRAAFERALRGAEVGAIAGAARRHGCSATLVETATRLSSTTPAAQYLRRSLQTIGRTVVLRGIAVRAQVVAVARCLDAAGIPFALLKGAARLYRDEPDAVLHASSDLDILVPAADLEAASQALREHGYYERADERSRRNYRQHHHHAAPLFPPTPGCAIELHVALAPPGNLSIPLDWQALQSRMTTADGPAGAVRVLDDVAGALHYAVHSIGLYRLRDSVLLAVALRALCRADLDVLRAIIKEERYDPIRLDAAVALAARMAGKPWPVSGPVEEYLRWSIRREDVPIYLAHRSQLAEGWYGGDRRVTPLLRRLVDPRSRLGPGRGGKPAVVAAAGRIVTGICAYLYALAMRPTA
jgi:Uncharacterised nucleotidyltransferase